MFHSSLLQYTLKTSEKVYPNWPLALTAETKLSVNMCYAFQMDLVCHNYHLRSLCQECVNITFIHEGFLIHSPDCSRHNLITT